MLNKARAKFQGALSAMRKLYKDIEDIEDGFFDRFDAFGEYYHSYETTVGLMKENIYRLEKLSRSPDQESDNHEYIARCKYAVMLGQQIRKNFIPSAEALLEEINAHPEKVESYEDKKTVERIKAKLAKIHPFDGRLQERPV